MTKKYVCQSCGEGITNRSVLKRSKDKDGKLKLFHSKFFGISMSTGSEEFTLCGPLKPAGKNS